MTNLSSKALIVGLLLFLGVGVAILIMRHREQSAEIEKLRTDLAAKNPNDTRKLPRPSAATAPQLTPKSENPEKPAKPTSVVEGEDTALITAARKLLELKPGLERTQRWQDSLARANTFELARMTEIVSQPPAPTSLDSDRRGLRLLVIKQFNALGGLQAFLEKRQQFDWPNSSHVQELCWQELASTAPEIAVKVWNARQEKLSHAEPHPKVLESFASGMSGANDLEKAAAVIKMLSARDQELVTGHLKKRVSGGK